MYGNSHSYRDGERKPCDQCELADDLCGQFRDIDGYRRYFIYVVTCYRAFIDDGKLCDGKSGSDNRLHSHRNDLGMYGNSNFNGDRESEPGGEREFANDLCGQFRNIDGYGSRFVYLVARGWAFGNDGQLCNRESCRDDRLHGNRDGQWLYRHGDFDGNRESYARCERTCSNDL